MKIGIDLDGVTANWTVAAREMLKGGAKVEIVARILGHAGVGVTCDIYRHVAAQELHGEHDRFVPLNGRELLDRSGIDGTAS